MSKEIQCNKCNGTGYIPIGEGIRGIKKCNECNGTGVHAYIKEQEMSLEEATEVLKVLIDILGVEKDLDTTILIKNRKRYKQAIETVLAELDNSISKDKIKEVIKEIEEKRKLAEQCIEQQIVVADSDSLNYGYKIAHKVDAKLLKELLEGEN